MIRSILQGAGVSPFKINATKEEFLAPFDVKKGDVFYRRMISLDLVGEPAVLPTGTGINCTFSPEGTYLAVASSGNPLTLYNASEPMTLEYGAHWYLWRIQDPNIFPAGTSRGCSFSPDGTRLAVAHSNSPFITLYDLSYGFPVKIPNPTVLPTGTGLGCSFSPDGTRLAVVHETYPYLTLYDISEHYDDGPTTDDPDGDGPTPDDDGPTPSDSDVNDEFHWYPVKMPNPDVLPAGTSRGCSFSPDGTRLAVAHSNSPYITVYDLSSGSPVKMPNPDVLPAGTGCGCSFSPGGTRLAVAHTIAPFITVYDLSSGSPVKMPNPAVLPTGTGNGCSFSPDGTRLAVAHGNSPYITAYQVQYMVYEKTFGNDVKDVMIATQTRQENFYLESYSIPLYNKL